MNAYYQNETAGRAPVVPEERRRLIAQRIRESGSVKVAALEQEFGISPMTARRDLAVLEQEGLARRTHGGAVRPGFSGQEDSFQERLQEEVGAKERLARAATSLLAPGETVFIDSSTTSYYAARRVLTEGARATVLTNLMPVMDLFASDDAPGVELVGIGGSFRKLTLSFVGPHTIETIGRHFADKVFLSVKGVTPDGYLTDPDPLEAEVKRQMIKHAREAVLLIHGRKFEEHGLSVVVHASEIATALVADAPDDRLHALEEMGVQARRV